MPKNAVEHICHVHILVNTINRDGDDMYFLVKKKGLYISDIQGTPSQRKEVGKWNVEVLSEKRATIFHLFTSWFASGKAFQYFQRKNLQLCKSGKKTSAKPYIVRLPYKRPQAWWRGHDCVRGPGHQSLLQVKANAESNKSSGRRIRWRCNYQWLGDYQGFRLILEHGSCPGPLESMKKDLFEKAVENPPMQTSWSLWMRRRLPGTMNWPSTVTWKFTRRIYAPTSATTRNNSLHPLEDRLIPLIFFERGERTQDQDI